MERSDEKMALLNRDNDPFLSIFIRERRKDINCWIKHLHDGWSPNKHGPARSSFLTQNPWVCIQLCLEALWATATPHNHVMFRLNRSYSTSSQRDHVGVLDGRGADSQTEWKTLTRSWEPKWLRSTTTERPPISGCPPSFSCSALSPSMINPAHVANVGVLISCKGQV
jgi:hypothetical protein